MVANGPGEKVHRFPTTLATRVLASITHTIRCLPTAIFRFHGRSLGMNRRSLFGRFAAPLSIDLERPSVPNIAK